MYLFDQYEQYFSFYKVCIKLIYTRNKKVKEICTNDKTLGLFFFLLKTQKFTRYDGYIRCLWPVYPTFLYSDNLMLRRLCECWSRWLKWMSSEHVVIFIWWSCVSSLETMFLMKSTEFSTKIEQKKYQSRTPLYI